MARPAIRLDPAPAIQVTTDLNPDGDVIFLPTDGYGTPGRLNKAILDTLKHPLAMPKARDLNKGYAIKALANRKFCFIVTISGVPTAQALAENFSKALADAKLTDATALWVPLMGTGEGQLELSDSFQILIEVLSKAKPMLAGQARATIAMPGDTPTELLSRLTADANTVAARIQRVARQAVASPSPKPPPPPPKSAALVGLARYKCSPAVTALFQLASLMGDHPKATHQALSTSLLFFALTDSDTPVSPEILCDDEAARLFRAAVRDRSEEFYEAAWQDYFGTEVRPATLAENTPTLPPSRNVEAVLARAHQLAGGTPEAVIEIDHIITALMMQPKARVHGRLTAMQLHSEDLLASYRDAKLGQVATKFQNDVANSDDHLDTARYADAIHAFLTDKDTLAPLSISIQAPWGGGKSTLMHQLRERLDPAAVRNRYRKQGSIGSAARLSLGAVEALLDEQNGIPIVAGEPVQGNVQRRWTIWFNAWKYETTEQLWAGLVDAIVSQVADRLSIVEREKFLLKLQLARIDDGILRKRIQDRIFSLWWGKTKALLLGGGAMVLSLFGLGAAEPLLPAPIAAVLSLGTGNGFTGSLVAQGALSLLLIGTYFYKSGKTKKEPARHSLADFLKVPDYDKGVGELHHVHNDLRRVLEIVPHRIDDQPAPLVIFIDDLDRCSPGKVAGVVEGVSMLLATDEYQCMFVIGMDPQMVAAALEKAHEDVRQKLPRYERTVPLGWRFMDKFVQLPFTLPPSGVDAFKAYIDWLAGPEPITGVLPPDELTRRLAEEKAREEAAAASAAKKVVAGQEAIGETLPADAEARAPQTAPRTMALIERSAAILKAAIAMLPRAASIAIEGSAKFVRLTVGEIDQVLTPALRPAATDDVEAEIFAESRNVGAIIRRIAEYSAGNPREMKRMVNLARFYLTLRSARRISEPKWQPPEPDQYARWIALTLRWPDMLRWLQWGTDEAHWPPEERGTELIARRLRLLERQAARAKDPKAWHKALNADLNLSAKEDPEEHDWSCDAQLFEFFKDEAALPMGTRLSDAAITGFW